MSLLYIPNRQTLLKGIFPIVSPGLEVRDSMQVYENAYFAYLTNSSTNTQIIITEEQSKLTLAPVLSVSLGVTGRFDEIDIAPPTTPTLPIEVPPLDPPSTDYNYWIQGVKINERYENWGNPSEVQIIGLAYNEHPTLVNFIRETKTGSTMKEKEICSVPKSKIGFAYNFTNKFYHKKYAGSLKVVTWANIYERDWMASKKPLGYTNDEGTIISSETYTREKLKGNMSYAHNWYLKNPNDGAQQIICIGSDPIIFSNSKGEFLITYRNW